MLQYAGLSSKLKLGVGLCSVYFKDLAFSQVPSRIALIIQKEF